MKIHKLSAPGLLAITLALPVIAKSQTSADSLSYVVINHGRPAGTMEVRNFGDSTVVRFQYVDRNRGPRVRTTYRFNKQGALSSMTSRGLGTDFFQTEVGDRYWTDEKFYHWKADADSGQSALDESAFYRAVTTTPFDDAALARFALSRPSKQARILPGGTVTAGIIADTTVSVGSASQRIKLVSLKGLYAWPLEIWLDDRGEVFATTSQWFTTIRRGWEPVLPALRKVEYDRAVARSAAIAKQLTPAANTTIVIRNGNLFDSEAGVLKPNMSVVVKGDRIVAVGPASSIQIPRGATVVDATGKTIVPGMWDMHTHLDFNYEEEGAMQLASGVTTVRDMASNIDDAVSRRARANDGSFLGPRQILSGFMDGPGAWAGPTEVLVSTPEDATRWIAVYDSLGYKQIKVYNLIHPDLIPTIAAETHKRGMRLSGHVARGLSVPDAVTLGYDEIQHAAFLFSTFYPDSLFVPKMRSYGQVAARVAPQFNLDGPEMTSLISFLRDHHTVIDGTFNAWLSRGAPLKDGTDMVFGPSLRWLPPAMARELTAPVTVDSADAATETARDAAYMRLLKKLFDNGVTLVAGTDNIGGISYTGELEIYERAGIPAPSVLQIATIGAARVMKEDKDFGSVAPGKIADLVIVDGKPAEKITELRKVESVMRAGRLYKSSDLLGAVGIKR